MANTFYHKVFFFFLSYYGTTNMSNGREIFCFRNWSCKKKKVKSMSVAINYCHC